MKMNKTINVYDFDRCLIRTSDHQSHNDHERDLYDWYDSPDSLDLNKYNIYCIENVAKDVRHRSERSEPVFLITQRVDTLRNEILNIFDHFNISFDDLFMLGRKDKKGRIMAQLVEKYEANHVRAFDDSLSELHSYSEYSKGDFKHLGESKLHLDLFYVDNSKIMKIGEPTVFEHDRIIITTKDKSTKDVG